MPRTELKVIASVALAVLALEGVMRWWAPTLDWDREHIHAFPELIADLHEKPAPRVVFFGNSLMLHGFDLETAVPKLSEASGKPCHAEKIVPVGTAIVDWIYLYERYFARTDQHPDAIVVGFVAHHLPDVEQVKIRRLARHFCSSEKLGQCLKQELDTFGAQATGFASHFSATYGDQRTIQHRMLSPLIPYYGEGTRSVNRIIRRSATNGKPKVESEKTYHRLERFIAQLKSAGVRAYFVPMPQPKVWDLDPLLVKTVEKNGMAIIDAREIDSITSEDFSDGYHLGESGKKKLSQFLAEQLGERIKGWEPIAPTPQIYRD